MGATQSLKKAIEEKNFKKSIEAVLQGADLSYKDGKQKTFVEYARSHNASQIASYLCAEIALKDVEKYKRMANGGTLDDIQEDNLTFLTFAVKHNIPHLTIKLLEKGASIDATDRSGATPLLHSVETNNTELSSQLINAKANVNVFNSWNQSPLYFAAINQNVELCRMLLTSGANANTPSNTGITPLIRSSTSDDLEIVKLLLESRAALDIGCARGETALFASSGKGNDRIVEVLLKAGANPNLANKDGYTPLINAARNGHAKVAKLLLQYRADPNVGADDKTTPLIHAATHSDVFFLQLLLDAGADVNHQSLSGLTALSRALEAKNLQNAQLLLDHDANVTVGSIRGQTFYEYLEVLQLTLANAQSNSLQIRSSAENSNTIYVKPQSQQPISPTVPKQAQYADIFNPKEHNHTSMSNPLNKIQPKNADTLRVQFTRSPSARMDNMFGQSPSGQLATQSNSDFLPLDLAGQSSFSTPPGDDSQLKQSSGGDQFLPPPPPPQPPYTAQPSTPAIQTTFTTSALRDSQSAINFSNTDDNRQSQTLYSSATGSTSLGGTPLVTPLKAPGSPAAFTRPANNTGSFSALALNTSQGSPFSGSTAQAPGTPSSLKSMIQSVTSNSSGSPALQPSSLQPQPSNQAQRNNLINVQYNVPQSYKNNTYSRQARSQSGVKSTDQSINAFQHSVNYSQLTQPKQSISNTPVTQHQPAFFIQPPAPAPDPVDDTLSRLPPTLVHQMSHLTLGQPSDLQLHPPPLPPSVPPSPSHAPDSLPILPPVPPPPVMDDLPPPIPPPVPDLPADPELLPPVPAVPDLPPIPDQQLQQQEQQQLQQQQLQQQEQQQQQQQQQSIYQFNDAGEGSQEVYDNNQGEEEFEEEEPLDLTNPDEINPKNWRAAKAEDGIYYYNTQTKTNRWTRPDQVLNHILPQCPKCDCAAFAEKDWKRPARCGCGHDHC